MKITVLILMFFCWSSFAEPFSASCIGKDKTIAPKPITEAWKIANPNWAVGQSWTCCENLVLNTATNVCEDKSLVDERFKNCSGHHACQGDLGCYHLSTSELYTTDSEDPAVKAAMKKLREIFNQQQATLKHPEKLLGQACYRNMECESYLCQNFKCHPRTICRHAHENESAPGPIRRYVHPLPSLTP